MRTIFFSLLLLTIPSVYAAHEELQAPESLCGRLLKADPEFAKIDRSHLENIMIQRLLTLQPNHPTEITMLMGRSGSGKTQIVNAMLKKAQSVDAPYIHMAPTVMGKEKDVAIVTNIPAVRDVLFELKIIGNTYKLLENRTIIEVLLNRIPQGTFLAIDFDWMHETSSVFKEAIFSLAQTCSLTVTTMDPVLKPYLSAPLQDRIFIINLDSIPKSKVLSPQAISFWGTFNADEQVSVANRIQNLVSRRSRERMPRAEFQQAIQGLVQFSLTGNLQLNDWPASSPWFEEMIAELRAHPQTDSQTADLLSTIEHHYKNP